MIRRPAETSGPIPRDLSIGSRSLIPAAKPFPGVVGPGSALAFARLSGTTAMFVVDFNFKQCLRCHRARRRREPVAGHDGWERYASAFPRRAAPGLCVSVHPLMMQRAQGRPGARCTRGLVCKVHKRKRTRAYRFSGGNPAFPAQWFYGLLRALPGDRLSCHRHFVRTCPTKLSASTGAPGPHDFAVRVELLSSVAAFASTASHRAFVTIASRPSCRVRRASW